MADGFSCFTTAALALLFAAAPLAADGRTVRYRVVPLTDISSGRTGCVPTAIDADGEAVGYCVAGELGSSAVLWRGGTLEDLRLWSAGTLRHAWGINSLGDIVGDDGNLDPKVLVRRGAGWVEIPVKGGGARRAVGIADDGTVFGNATNERANLPDIEGWDPVFWTYDAKHERYDPYDRLDLPRPPSRTGSAGPSFTRRASWASLSVKSPAMSSVVRPRCGTTIPRIP
jgi:hypothetical protein